MTIANRGVPFVDLTQQSVVLSEEIMARLASIMTSGAFIGGAAVEAFEREFADYIGVRYAVGVANGTDAITLALKSLGIGRGDEVITAANTFIATIESILHVGGRPVLVDVDTMYNMDPGQIERAITDHTKAVIPVHLYGQPADMEPILEVARKHRLVVVEDAAQAHGAKYRGACVGTFGNAGCFSFYPSKNLGAFGDAGAIVTDDCGVYQTLLKLRNHGSVRKYEHDIVGYNSRLDSIQAAVLSIKLKQLDCWNKRRQDLARLYCDLLARIPGVVAPTTTSDRSHVYHLFVIRVGQSRGELQEHLQRRGISTGIHYPQPVHLTKALGHLGYSKGSFPNAERYARSILSLPMYPEMTVDDVQYVVACIREYMEGRIASCER